MLYPNVPTVAHCASTKIRGTLAAAALLAIAPFAEAGDDLFHVNVIEPGAGGSILNEVSIGANSFPDLARNIIKSQGDFAVFSSAINFAAKMDYLGVADAIKISITNGTQAEIQFLDWAPVIIDGTDRSNLLKNAEDYFLKNGSDIYGRFLREVARQSAVSITDGNPTASTARMSTETFSLQGWTPLEAVSNLFDFDSPDGAAAAQGQAQDTTHDRMKTFGFGVGFNGGTFKAGNFKGSYLDVAVPWNIDLSRYVSIAPSVGLNYLEIEHAQVFGASLGLAVPVRIFEMTQKDDWNWRLTPFAGVSARGSYDLAAGGLIAMGGLANSVEYRLGRNWVFSMGNQISYHKSIAVPLPDGYEFDIEVEQFILKNGLRASWQPHAKFTASAFVIETNFLREAAIPNYTTVGIGLVYSFNKTYSIGLAANYDFAKDYSSYSVGLFSAWKF